MTRTVAVSVLCLICAGAVRASAAAPDWVVSGGAAVKYGSRQYLTGFAVADNGQLETAKAAAAAALAQQVSVRIESDNQDISVEKNGKADYMVSAFTRATTDIRLSGLRYETHAADGKAYALAILSREQAARERRELREQALAAARQALARAARAEADKAEATAVAAYLATRTLLASALEHDSVAKAVAGGEPGAQRLSAEVSAMNATCDERVLALLRKPVSSLDDALAVVALQLAQQGVAAGVALTAAPLTFGTTAFSSAFGRQASLELEGKITRAQPPAGVKALTQPLALRGTYTVLDALVRIVVVAREVTSGRALASAEVSLSAEVLPKSLSLVPQNLQQALVDQKVLADGELVSGDLRVELWTSKGARDLVFQAKEEVRFFLRVNKPCWVRLVYLLASNAKVPIAQSYYIDASKVNLAVEYPDVFEVAAPFGVERVYAVAFTDKPEPLPTEPRTIDGERYDVVAELKTLVKHRGIKAKKSGPQTAEAFVTMTTVP